MTKLKKALVLFDSLQNEMISSITVTYLCFDVITLP